MHGVVWSHIRRSDWIHCHLDKKEKFKKKRICIDAAFNQRKRHSRSFGDKIDMQYEYYNNYGNRERDTREVDGSIQWGQRDIQHGVKGESTAI